MLFIEDPTIDETRTMIFFFGCMHCIFLANAEWFLLSDHTETYVEED